MTKLSEERRRRRLRVATMAIVMSLALIAAGCSNPATSDEALDSEAAATAPVVRPTLVFVVNDWTASALNVAVAEQLIERHLGYPVEPLRLDDTIEIYESMAEGDIDATLEIWPSNMTDQDRLYFKRDQVVDIGPLGSTGKVGWFVPRYVLEDDATLATWEGFRSPDVAARFATEQTGTQGRFLGTNPDYAQFDEQIIDNLGLPFVVDYSGSEAGTMAEVAASVEAREPLLLYWWMPTAAVARFDLVNVALPPRTDACAEAAAGEQGRVDCDYPSDELFKAISVDLPAKAPDVLSFLQRFSLTTEDQMGMLAAVEIDGASIDSAAAAWIVANPQHWESWLQD